MKEETGIVRNSLKNRTTEKEKNYKQYKILLESLKKQIKKKQYSDLIDSCKYDIKKRGML